MRYTAETWNEALRNEVSEEEADDLEWIGHHVFSSKPMSIKPFFDPPAYVHSALATRVKNRLAQKGLTIGEAALLTDYELSGWYDVGPAWCRAMRMMASGNWTTAKPTDV